MRTLICTAMVSGLVVASCGRIGFDNLLDGGGDLLLDDGGILVIDGAGASNDALDSSVGPDASSPVCPDEALLASFTETHSDRLGFEATHVIATFRSMSSLGFIGTNAIHQAGYSGIRDFRADDSTSFNSVMMPLSDGTDTSVRIGMYDPTTTNGSSVTVALTAPLAGRTITMARQNVIFISLTPVGGGRTDFAFEATWELYGCPAAP